MWKMRQLNQMKEEAVSIKENSIGVKVQKVLDKVLSKLKES